MKCGRILALSTLVLSIATAAGLTIVKGKNVIAKDQLIEMFENMPRGPGWDTSKPMQWGYFFTDPSKEKLQKAAVLLEQQGYRVVDIYLSDKDDPKKRDLWWLHVEKVEIHSPDTLDQRNQLFYRFADEQGLESYDGMDVGPAPEKRQ